MFFQFNVVAFTNLTHFFLFISISISNLKLNCIKILLNLNALALCMCVCVYVYACVLPELDCIDALIDSCNRNQC